MKADDLSNLASDPHGLAMIQFIGALLDELEDGDKTQEEIIGNLVEKGMPAPVGAMLFLFLASTGFAKTRTIFELSDKGREALEMGRKKTREIEGRGTKPFGTFPTIKTPGVFARAVVGTPKYTGTVPATLPVTDGVGGPVVGEATTRKDKSGNIIADVTVTPEMAEKIVSLTEPPPSMSSRVPSKIEFASDKPESDSQWMERQHRERQNPRIFEMTGQDKYEPKSPGPIPKSFEDAFASAKAGAARAAVARPFSGMEHFGNAMDYQEKKKILEGKGFTLDNKKMVWGVDTVNGALRIPHTVVSETPARDFTTWLEKEIRDFFTRTGGFGTPKAETKEAVKAAIEAEGPAVVSLGKKCPVCQKTFDEKTVPIGQSVCSDACHAELAKADTMEKATWSDRRNDALTNLANKKPGYTVEESKRIDANLKRIAKEHPELLEKHEEDVGSALSAIETMFDTKGTGMPSPDLISFAEQYDREQGLVAGNGPRGVTHAVATGPASQTFCGILVATLVGDDSVNAAADDGWRSKVTCPQCLAKLPA